MQAQFVQTCTHRTPLLTHYETKDGRPAGPDIKKAIAATGFEGYYPFTVKNLNTGFFAVQQIEFEKQLYAVVTNYGVKYFFIIQ